MDINNYTIVIVFLDFSLESGLQNQYSQLHELSLRCSSHWASWGSIHTVNLAFPVVVNFLQVALPLRCMGQCEPLPADLRNDCESGTWHVY